MTAASTTLYRPVGQAELDLIAATGYRRFPPRLPDQPIFYPVCNETYAAQIASRWNTAQGAVGYVTRFEVRSDFLAKYDVQVVGSKIHAEYWIPAEELEAFNDAIVGTIEVISEHRAEGQGKGEP
ncbi:ADP-ribosylation/crystallin J1 [Polyangium jinanense]|uniref:ADP-ribosylation/crystallin J1 n=1 Tax=Polyangium jinanense TaxID=2829994 RepID=A0A9X3X9V3_9BACT|nr:ADP-ribosylation/crystallin J1 [Polyangium jinanense]MDC3958976.1 ADP-ribosylation/crystallin J1 [Polyangium jinanense]MDC3986399.1 ADP-ribosylation/crystallin J1 [Polyangium jinanense]